jgi:hypothetical protein
MVTFVALLLLLAAMYIGMYWSKKGKKITIRELSPVKAIAECVGRCAEMGKPLYYSPGYYSEIASALAGQTMASMAVLSYTAELCAKNNVEIICTTFLSEVVPIVEDVMTTAYRAAGHPERKANVTWLGQGYIWGTQGIIMREKPAATVLVGPFSADTLPIAEVANIVGALQTGGTARYSLLPTFVVALDYCLLGEEVWAAQATITKSPMHLGTIWAQDMAKFAFSILVIIGMIITILGYKWPF